MSESTPARWLKALRPLEWAVVGFVLFVWMRVGTSVFAEWRELAGQRTVTLFFALSLVAFITLAVRFASTPWADVRLAPRHRLALLPAALPLAAFGVIALEQGHQLFREGRPAQHVAALAAVGLRVVGLGLPTLFLWLVVGLELKRHGRVRGLRTVPEAVAQLLGALREWVPLLLILSAYAWMDAVVGGKLGEGRDALMLRADRALFLGHDPQDLLSPWLWAPLSEWLAFCYTMYAVLYPLVLGVLAFRGGTRALRVASWPLGIGLLAGYVSYSFIPVKGPLLTRSFDTSLDLYLIGPMKEAMMDATRVTYDCFPSMHTCCTVLLGWAAWRFVPRLFWGLSPIIVSMPLACVYLRYHYVVDVLAGLGLAAALIAMTAWFERRSEWLRGV